MVGQAQKSEFEFTSPSEPKLELQSKSEAAEYLSKLSKLARREDLYIELANVMAAKYNLMSMPTEVEINTRSDKLVGVSVSQNEKFSIATNSTGKKLP